MTSDNMKPPHWVQHAREVLSFVWLVLPEYCTVNMPSRVTDLVHYKRCTKTTWQVKDFTPLE